MPAQYHINHEDELVAIQLEGDVDLVEVYELCQSLLSDPAFNPRLPQLADVRNVNLKMTPGAIRPFLNYVTTKYRPRVAGRIAVVLDGSMDDDFCAGVFRFVCNLQETEVFDDYAMAIKWLLREGGIQPASSKPQDASRNHADEHPKQIRA